MSAQSVTNNGRTKNQNKILKMLQELESDFKGCKRDIKFIKQCWGSEEDDSKYDVDSDSEYQMFLLRNKKWRKITAPLCSSVATSFCCDHTQ